MEKLSMKTMDMGLQTMGKPKSAGQTADVSGDYDFRKMLQSKNENAQESQNAQDKDQQETKSRKRYQRTRVRQIRQTRQTMRRRIQARQKR